MQLVIVLNAIRASGFIDTRVIVESEAHFQEKVVLNRFRAWCKKSVNGKFRVGRLVLCDCFF